MTREQTLRLEEMTDKGKSPSEIMDDMKRQWPDINIVKRDIYNARKKHKENKQNGVATSPAEEQEWEDPNGVMPGPTPNGKWIWAEDGDEIVTKGKRKKRKQVYVPATPPTLDPQLQSSQQSPPQNQSFAVESLPSNLGFQNFASTYEDSSAMHLQTGGYPRTLDRHHSAPNALQQLSAYANGQDNGNFPHPAEDSSTFFPQHSQRNSFPSITAPQLQQQQQLNHSGPAHAHAEPAVMASQQPKTRSATAAAAAVNQFNGPISPRTASAPAQAPSSRNQNGQMFLKRIERMEKEQSDQKRMLSQILGAVTGQKTDA